MTVNNTSDGSMLHVTATSPSSTSSSSPQGFVFTNCKFNVRLPISDVHDTYNVEKATWGAFHIVLLKKVVQG
jgi:hypothetical protein